MSRCAAVAGEWMLGAGEWMWGRGLTHNGASEDCQTAPTAASATRNHRRRSGRTGALAPARTAWQGQARAAEGETRAGAVRRAGSRARRRRSVPHMSIDWGSVPDWFAGVGALVALFFARSAVLSARDTNRSQSEQIARLEAEQKVRDFERRAEQASNVAAWVSMDSSNGEERPAIRLVNSSTLPVYDMLIVCRIPERLGEERYSVIGPLSGRRNLTRATAVLVEVLGDADFVGLHDRAEVRVAISFRDAAGRWWYRPTGGELQEAASRELAEAGVAHTDLERGSPAGVGPLWDHTTRARADQTLVGAVAGAFQHALTCGNRLPAGLGVKGSQVQVLSSRQPEQAR